jgi:hypothetical protein
MAADLVGDGNQHCGWPTPEAEPVCRNCGTDARLGARRFAPAGPGYAPAAGGLATSTNGLAIASLVLGILWLYWVGSILALVFGYLARRQIAQRQGVQGGRGLATAGIVLGWVGIGFLALFIMVAMSAWPPTRPTTRRRSTCPSEQRVPAAGGLPVLPWRGWLGRSVRLPSGTRDPWPRRHTASRGPRAESASSWKR